MAYRIGESLSEDVNLHIESSSHYAQVEEKYKEMYGSAVEALKADPENDLKLLDLLIVRQEYYNTVERYDATGAFNAREFHEDIGEYFSDRQYVLDENGLLSVDASDSKYTFLGVTFNSLAAANKIRHDQGDKALAESVQAMERTLLAAGLTLDDFKIYRLKGSDFVVRLTNDKVKDLESLKSNITTARTPTGDLISQQYGGLKTQLVNVDMERSTSIELFNNLQTELKNRGDAPLIFDSQGSVQKYLTGLTLDLLEAKREQAFLFSMLADTAKHTWSLLAAGDSENAKKSLNYYNLFAARFFTDFSDLKELDNLLPNLPHSERTFYEQLDRKVRLASAQLASERVFGAREERSNVTEILSKLSLEKLTQDTEVEEVIREHVVSGLVPESLEDTAFSLFATNAKDTDFKSIFTEYETKQKRVTSEASIALSYINEVIKDGKIDNEESVTLGYAISGYAHFLQEGGDDYFNSTVTVGNRSYDLYDLLLRNVATWDVQKAERAKKLFNEILYTHERRYDLQTGLPKKETFLRESDDMIMNGILNNENFTYIMGDLAFLRHSNEAGRITGNAAIAVTSYSFEKAAIDSTYEYTIARYGGDEFTGVLKGAFTNVSEVEARYASTFFDTSQEYNIPAAKKDVDNYLPHTVTLNIGFCSKEWGLQGIKDLLAAGTFGEADAAVLQKGLAMVELGDTTGLKAMPKEELHYFSTMLSKTMARIADRSMEISKAQHRACYLYGMYERLRAHDISKNTKAWKTFNTIFLYSQKAIPDVTLANFEDLYTELQAAEKLSQDDKESLVIDRFGQFKDRTDKGKYEAILKELVSEHMSS